MTGQNYGLVKLRRLSGWITDRPERHKPLHCLVHSLAPAVLISAQFPSKLISSCLPGGTVFMTQASDSMPRSDPAQGIPLISRSADEYTVTLSLSYDLIGYGPASHSEQSYPELNRVLIKLPHMLIMCTEL